MPQQSRELSPAEWELMAAIWQLPPPVTVRQVLTRAYPNAEKAYTTVQTLMNILVDKGFLARRKVGNRNQYEALVDRSGVVGGSVKNLASRMFHGSVGALASYLVGSGQLTDEEIAELRDILASKTAEARKGGQR